MSRRDTGDTRGFKSLDSGDIPGLDGLRAISVLLVMASHYADNRYVPGRMGVMIFFFISGFLITTLLYRESMRTGSISLRDFYIRRFLRIQPELWVFLIISGIAGPLYGERASLGAIAAAVLSFTNYMRNVPALSFPGQPSHWIQLWSLAVEEHYYLTYPLLFLFFNKKPKRMLQILVAICVVTLAWRCILAANPDNAAYIMEASDTRVDSIVYGCILSVVALHFSEKLSFLDRILPTLIPLGLFALILSLTIREQYFRDSFRFTLQSFGIFLIMLAMLTTVGRNQTKFLNWPAMAWLGRMSYAAYLWQLVPFDAIRYYLHIAPEQSGLVAGCGVGVAAGVSTFALAALSHHLVYRPILAIRRRFGSHRTTEPTSRADLGAMGLAGGS